MGIAQDILNNVLIPTLNVSRLVNREVDPKEKLNKSQVYVTSAGYKNTFSYEKLIDLLCMSVAKPDDAMILGGTWRVPFIEGLLDRDFVNDLKMDGTYNDASFDREYNSKWAGDVEFAFYRLDWFDRQREINQPEYQYNIKKGINCYYVMGVDIGRHNCNTEIAILKVFPSGKGKYIKQLVNLYSFEAEHFGLQAIELKRLYNKYHCRVAVVDGNGLGQGIVDYLVTDQTDPDTGDILYNWGVINDDDNRYKKFKTEDTIQSALYIMRANTALNSEMYSYLQQQLRNSKIKFLIDQNTAKNKLLSQEKGKRMTPSQREEYLKPFTFTSILIEQTLNMIQKDENSNGQYIILKPSNRSIPHDKFSALIYGLYYCKLEEDRNSKKKKRNIKDLMFFN